MSAIILNGAARRTTSKTGRFATAISRAWNQVGRLADVLASRRDLLAMDDRTLKDLGISRAQAEFEATRAPWRLDARD